jgi:hypothetical protein
MPTKGRPTYWEIGLEYLREGSRAIVKGGRRSLRVAEEPWGRTLMADANSSCGVMITARVGGR